MSNKRSYSSILTVELFSSQESSLYCQDLFGYNTSNVLYLLWNFKEAVKQLRSKVVHSNPLDINSLEKNSSRSPLTQSTTNKASFQNVVDPCVLVSRATSVK